MRFAGIASIIIAVTCIVSCSRDNREKEKPAQKAEGPSVEYSSWQGTPLFEKQREFTGRLMHKTEPEIIDTLGLPSYRNRQGDTLSMFYKGMLKGVFAKPTDLGLWFRKDRVDVVVTAEPGFADKQIEAMRSLKVNEQLERLEYPVVEETLAGKTKWEVEGMLGRPSGYLKLKGKETWKYDEATIEDNRKAMLFVSFENGVTEKVIKSYLPPADKRLKR